jgi:23S rRNA pseudouridine2605 synthase
MRRPTRDGPGRTGTTQRERFRDGLDDLGKGRGGKGKATGPRKPYVGKPRAEADDKTKPVRSSATARSGVARAETVAPRSGPRGIRFPRGGAGDTGGAPAGEMRIAKALARAGLCSRREAERWIEDGRVSVNGKVLSSPALDVKPSDRIVVDGNPLPSAEPARLWRYHKPKGLVTTHSDPEGRPTVFDHLPSHMPRVISIGRLDFNTEGLLLLTNDGELARHLELPATGWLRRYRVRAHGMVTQAKLDTLKDGVEIEGVRYGPVDATLDTPSQGTGAPSVYAPRAGANVWLSIGLREGKNREVRKILATLGLEVNRLIRVSFGPFQLLDLEPGDTESVRRRVLADQLGPELSAQFGLASDDEDEPAPKQRGGGFVAKRPLKVDTPKPFAARGQARVRDHRDDDDDRDERPQRGGGFVAKRPLKVDDAGGYTVRPRGRADNRTAPTTDRSDGAKPFVRKPAGRKPGGGKPRAR